MGASALVTAISVNPRTLCPTLLWVVLQFKAIKTITEIDTKLLTPKILFEFDNLATRIFSSVNTNSLTVTVISKFNEEINKDSFRDARAFLSNEELFEISIFDEEEENERKDAINHLEWNTSIRLFTEVFTDKSRFMTVHQSKGQEWNSVIVSLTPTKFDKTKLSAVFSNPQIMQENPSDEFVRMFYVACSRAKDDLYIHVDSGCTEQEIETALTSFISKTGLGISYEFIQ